MASSPTYWPTGEPIVSREVWRGRVWTVRPMTLVRDDADLIAYYMAPGTRYLHPRAPDGGPIPHFLPDDWRLVERTCYTMPMTSEALVAQQRALQDEAHQVLRTLNLLESLGRYGTPTIVGSVALGTMTWRDIDVELRKPIDEDAFWQTAQYLIKQPGLVNLTLMDYRTSVNPNTPKGLYLGIRYDGIPDTRWKIDLWFLDERMPGEADFHAWAKARMTEEHRNDCLAIKAVVGTLPEYGKTIYSVDIYRAVIEEGVKDLEGFQQYLKGRRREV